MSSATAIGRSAQPDQLDRLERLGLIEAAARDRSSVPAPRLPAPQRSAIEANHPGESFNAFAAAEVAYLVAAARRRVARRALDWNIADLERRRTGGHVAPAGCVAALARRFNRYRRLVPLASKCLPDTLAFLRFAARRGHFPRLVFGVEAWPFAAHCWAQSEALVLNDALDHARTFSPILVL
ncbi:MAG: lasso peptide biosynthesis B2 protein [Candidatus Sphingomonas phytovorans]|nr:lasso peptide biosynthesis B2 protein [Sphingomonas sp.]WEK02187.1 MAG: lasso peptide biosynthesis B2 protein [Sphingomonas sp.]